MDADGGNVTRLTTHRSDGLPTWSPDGRQIAFASARGSDEAALDRFGLAMHRMLYLMQPDGSGIRRLTDAPAAGFRWSPDGQWLVFQSSYEDEKNYHVEDWVSSAIYLIAATGGGHKRLTGVQYRNAFPAWSPDGGRIAFSSDRDGNWELYVMQRDGRRHRRLTNTPAAERYPVWSPDGRKLAFASRDPTEERRGSSGFANVHVRDLETGEVRHLSAAPATETPRAWSPDGAWILFTTQDDLFLVHHETARLVRLTQTPARELGSVFHPAGDRVVFRSNPEGNWEIFVVRTDGTGLTNLTNDPADELSFSVTPCLNR